MALTAIEQQEKYARLGVVTASILNKEEEQRQIKAALQDLRAEMKALYAELGISNRRQRKVTEKPPRKVRSDKGLPRKDTKAGEQA